MQDETIAIIARKEALALGLKRYYTGKPCKRGHVAERRVDDWTCLACKKETGSIRYETNREKLAEQQRIYRKTNYEKIKEQRRREAQRIKQGRLALQVLKRIKNMNLTT